MTLHTQVAETERQEVKCMDTDEGLDKLLRKAVTVSQVNLPIATINKDIDDIASSYSEENERPDNVLDEAFVVTSVSIHLVFMIEHSFLSSYLTVETIFACCHCQLSLSAKLFVIFEMKFMTGLFVIKKLNRIKC